jgi:hypothetical protein
MIRIINLRTGINVGFIFMPKRLISIIRESAVPLIYSIHYFPLFIYTTNKMFYIMLDFGNDIKHLFYNTPHFGNGLKQMFYLPPEVGNALKHLFNRNQEVGNVLKHLFYLNPEVGNAVKYSICCADHLSGASYLFSYNYSQSTFKQNHYGC